MQIEIVSVYDDVAFRVNKDQDGDLSYEKFNSASKLAELRFIDWLSGDVEGIQPPIPYLSQKNKDWLAPFIESKKDQVTDGYITRPDNYYGFENLFRLGSKDDACDDGEDNCNRKIELVSSSEFDNRCTSDIEELRPSMENPIAKEIGRRFFFAPKTMGSLTLEYIRYPKFGKIVTKEDKEYNELVPDLSANSGTTNYEWDENAREALVYFITDQFSDHIRERALKEMNGATGKFIRDQKK